MIFRHGEAGGSDSSFFTAQHWVTPSGWISDPDNVNVKASSINCLLWILPAPPL